MTEITDVSPPEVIGTQTIAYGDPEEITTGAD